MRLAVLALIITAALGFSSVPASVAQTTGPYKVLTTKIIGGDGRFDYVYADVTGRRLYVPRLGATAAYGVFDLDTLAPAGSIPNTSGHGAAVDDKTHHGFGSSKPVAMWDSSTLAPIKTIDVGGQPDRIMADPFNGRIYVMSHVAPIVTVLAAKDGSILGTIDLGGAAEEAVSDGKGRVYVDVEDKANIAVIDAKTMTVVAHYDLADKGGVCAGLAIDRKNNLLFAACRKPQTMVVLSAVDGKILATFPIGMAADGAAFNPNTNEAFASANDGTLTVVKENTPASFSLEQTLQTKPGAKTLAIDPKTNRLFMVTVDYAPGPPAAPGAPPSPPQIVPGSYQIVVVGK